MHSATSIDYAAPVRLSFADPLARNVGFVVGLARVRESDNMKFWLVDFPEQDGDPVEIAASALVPVCSWEHTFRDFDGTYAGMLCGYDASSVVRYVDPYVGQPDTVPACAEHATFIGLDLDAKGVPFDVAAI